MSGNKFNVVKPINGNIATARGSDRQNMQRNDGIKSDTIIHAAFNVVKKAACDDARSSRSADTDLQRSILGDDRNRKTKTRVGPVRHVCA